MHVQRARRLHRSRVVLRLYAHRPGVHVGHFRGLPPTERGRVRRSRAVRAQDLHLAVVIQIPTQPNKPRAEHRAGSREEVELQGFDRRRVINDWHDEAFGHWHVSGGLAVLACGQLDQRKSGDGYQAVEEEVVIVRHRCVIEDGRRLGAFVVLLQQCSRRFLGIFGVWDEVLESLIQARVRDRLTLCQEVELVKDEPLVLGPREVERSR